MKVYINRINGYALSTFWLGFILSNISEKTKIIEILLLTVITLIWFYNHDKLNNEGVKKNVGSNRN